MVSYRYGFNGMEKDDELKGSGNSYDFGARIYDSRIGRWMSIDPLANKYPGFSPYNYVLNNPIAFIDPDGRVVVFVHLEVRVSAPLLGPLGITSGGAFGIAIDFEGNVGVYETGNLGIQCGAGGTVSLSGGAIFNAETIYDIQGWGVNIGAFAAPEIVGPGFSGEINMAVPTEKAPEGELFGKESPDAEFSDVGIGGTVGTPANLTFGGSAYGDFSYTWVQGTSWEDMYKDLNELIKEEFGYSLEDVGVTSEALLNQLNMHQSEAESQQNSSSDQQSASTSQQNSTNQESEEEQ